MNYTELKLAIENASLRTDLDLPLVIKFGQSYLEDLLRIPEMEHTPDGTTYIPNGDTRISIPSDYIELKRISITDQLRRPINATFTSAAGSLAAGTYYYRVSALNATGETDASTETSVVLASTGGVNINWGKVDGATGYNIYGRTTGAELLIATVGDVATYLDGGTITPTGALPELNTTGTYRYPKMDRFPNEWNSDFEDFIRDIDQSGRPEYYERKGDYIHFDKYADKDYVYDMRYYRRLPTLSDSNRTNYWSTKMEEALLYACLVKAVPIYFWDDPRGKVWGNVFSELIGLKARNVSKEASSGRADRRGTSKLYY